MNPQIPNIASVAGAIVLLANMFLDTNLVEEETRQVLNAVVILFVAVSGTISWFKTQTLVAKNASLTATLTAKRFASASKKRRK